MPAIHKIDFINAFEHPFDGSYSARQLTYVDRDTGDVLWVYENDEEAWDEANMPAEENREIWERVMADRARYLEIDALDYTDQRDILIRFLRSNWTDDELRWERASAAWSGAIGRWKRDVRDEEAVRAYFAFQEQEVLEMAEEFLRENGIEPQWR